MCFLLHDLKCLSKLLEMDFYWPFWTELRWVCSDKNVTERKRTVDHWWQEELQVVGGIWIKKCHVDVNSGECSQTWVQPQSEAEQPHISSTQGTLTTRIKNITTMRKQSIKNIKPSEWRWQFWKIQLTTVTYITILFKTFEIKC